MTSIVDEYVDLIRALRLSADPPADWIEAAALLPSTLGDLQRLHALLADEDFRRRFGEDPERALGDEGLPATAPVIAAVRERLG